jgi:hypothetical protein
VTHRGSARVGIGLTVVITLITLLSGCTASDEEAVVPPSTASLAESSGYRLELESRGAGDRHDLVVPVPTGRTVGVTVSLGAQGETVRVELVATLVRADADGVGQEIELRIVDVEADDQDTADGLASIVDASSVLRRDRHLAVVEQVLDVPADLAFRADAVARQVLRAPFALVGPLPLESVGAGAVWQVQSMEDGETVDTRQVSLVEVDSDGYAFSFELPDGEVEIVGSSGALLPDRQVITLDDADLTVTAERTG